jgi:hypothetical protein
MTRFGAVTAKSMNIIFWDVTPCGLVETYYMRSCPTRRLSSISKSRFVSCDVMQHPFLTTLISDRRSRQWWVEHQSFRDRFVPINSSNRLRHRLWLLRHSRSPKLWILAHQWHIWGYPEQCSETSSKRMLPISIFNYALLVFMVWYFPIDKFVELEKLLGCMNWLNVLCSLCCEVKLTRKLGICLAGWLPFTSRSGTSVATKCSVFQTEEAKILIL